MKKISYKKVLSLLGWLFASTAIAFSLAFVSKSARALRVERLDVTIENNEVNDFVPVEEVKTLVNANNDVVDRPLGGISVPGIESRLNAHPSVENAEVCADLSGALRISITQRTPVIRIINKNGESYYLDARGFPMPLSENFTARVPVATGEIFEPYARRYQQSAAKIASSKVFSEISVLDDLYRMAIHIGSDSLLSSLVQQIQVNRDGELELYPAVGDHRIVFGDCSDMEAKFRKLILFYTEGLNKRDCWNSYSTLSLKYKNLVVCTKK